MRNLHSITVSAITTDIELAFLWWFFSREYKKELHYHPTYGFHYLGYGHIYYRLDQEDTAYHRSIVDKWNEAGRPIQQRLIVYCDGVHVNYFKKSGYTNA